MHSFKCIPAFFSIIISMKGLLLFTLYAKLLKCIMKIINLKVPRCESGRNWRKYLTRTYTEKTKALTIRCGQDMSSHSRNSSFLLDILFMKFHIAIFRRVNITLQYYLMMVFATYCPLAEQSCCLLNFVFLKNVKGKKKGYIHTHVYTGTERESHNVR